MTRRDGRPRPDDEGFSLTEIMVTMGIMSAVMLVFTGAILQVYRTVQATDTLTDAQAQLSIAFQRFDRYLRYATWVSKPGVRAESGGHTWYVEFAGVAGEKCRQLRLELGPDPGSNSPTGQGLLQLLEWTPGSPPAEGSRGMTIASHIDTTKISRQPAAAPGKYLPFELQEIDSKPYANAKYGKQFTTEFDRLRVHLSTKVAAGASEIDISFTALNTERETPATNQCSEGRPS
ncbi:PulJ/GspJ family protein [Couchioplanes azureus]|uniref:PulJ/GspJ family protein n=1 Tax=Couchioplanes caeruleus TaxID=56438 RepID=UPI00166FF33A|nr:prepilin-type N-terminal cleavage/methylation domain-containing protein [Couchioplanes caeruleus]